MLATKQYFLMVQSHHVTDDVFELGSWYKTDIIHTGREVALVVTG